jgi:hypothetical protein
MGVVAALLSEPPKLSFGRRVEARAAVLVATLLARWSPQRIRTVLAGLAVGQRSATQPEVEQAWEAAVGVSARCAGRRGCLVRSLAIVLLCRWHGSWPTWCVGVRDAGLPEAHAWVEVDGRPVRELPGTAEAYRVVLSVGPVGPGGSVGP